MSKHYSVLFKFAYIYKVTISDNYPISSRTDVLYIYESSIHKVRDLLFQPWLGSPGDSDPSN